MKMITLVMLMLIGLNAQANLESLAENIKQCFTNKTESSMSINERNRSGFQITTEVKCEGSFASDLYMSLSQLDEDFVKQTRVFEGEEWIEFGKEENSYNTNDGRFISLGGVSFITNGSTCKKKGLDDHQYECFLNFKMTLNPNLSNALRKNSTD